MTSPVVVNVLRTLMLGSLLALLFLQIIGLPWLSGVMALDFPAEAYMRWPILALSILGLGCAQAGIYSVFRLLGFTRRGDVFSSGALLWVNTIIIASLSGSLICIATLVYQSFTVGGPPVWTLLLLCGTVSGVGLALLLHVMRTLLIQATMLRREMEAVI